MTSQSPRRLLAQWRSHILVPKLAPRSSNPSADAIGYQDWQQRFVWQRTRLGICLAIVAYPTFIGLRLLRGAFNPVEWDDSWLTMAVLSEMGLLSCWAIGQRAIGKQRPELLFLGASWSITLMEQVWATWKGFAFPGIYTWTLAFMTSATLMPMRWPLHLLSQLGVLCYYYGVNSALGLAPAERTLWDPLQLLFLFWFCIICDLSVYLYERLQRSEFFAHRQLEREQEKSEQLLLNILPQPVAQQLKQAPHTIAESFAEVTVLFADIVGFTQLSAHIPATELVTLLNQIFSAFDRLAEQHGLEKIKTIGDAYMVVGGLPTERPDHVEAIARMALDMQQTIAQFSAHSSQLPISIRIGINTGSVVAGVIGTKKFIYDLWGDTVNVASRMESHGIAGQIQVTAAVYDRLYDRFRLEKRGEIEVKGKGAMTTYWLVNDR